MRPAHVPVEILGLHVERKNVCQKSVRPRTNIAGGVGRQAGGRAETCLSADVFCWRLAAGRALRHDGFLEKKSGSAVAALWPPGRLAATSSRRTVIYACAWPAGRRASRPSRPI